MLEQARTHGYISDYRGVRISRSGKRFLVETGDGLESPQTRWDAAGASGDVL